ncbi:MAG: hypothetical protein HS119_03960 [Flavobacteriales bacterium]|nr:hypothetical protein [Flavobacteriales bacterium]MCL4857089.1 hypothetical protein [Flavobacteriales bacterium]
MKNISIIIISLIIGLPSVKSQCTLNNSEVNSTYISTSGISEIDNLIKSEKIKLEQFFNVKVEMKTCNGYNGLARSSCASYNCNGTIELGKGLLLFEYKKKGPSSGYNIGKYMIISIMAHEFAHIFQYSHPEFRFKNSVVQEVHADMLAGWYMTKYFMDNTPGSDKYGWYYSSEGSKVRDIWTDMTISFGWMGDKAYWSKQHHGNYSTRALAFHEGWSFLAEREIKDFSYYLDRSVQIAESLIERFDNE